MHTFKKVASVAALIFMTATSCFAANGTVTTDALNIRSAPATDSSVIAKAYTGDVLDVIGTDGSFYIVNYNGTTAYTSKDYVSVDSGSVGTITTNGLNVREQPSSSAASVGKFNSGDTVNIVGSSGDWYEILLYGELRYVHSDYVTKGGNAPAAASSVSPDSGTGSITTDGLNVRADASSSATVIGKLNYGDTVEISGKSGDWYEISYSGKTGYVHGDYVTKGALPAKTKAVEKTSATVVTDGLNVRTAASSDASSVDKLYYGTKVTIIGESGDWYEISYSGKTGYVHGDYITTRDVSSSSSRSLHVSREGGSLVEYSKKFLGVPYVSGGSTPSGFDCSGFTSYVFAQYGYSIPRTAASQASVGTPVSKSELMPGDLVFFNTYGGISHVGIFTGGDSFIHASVPGDVVKMGSLSTAYYKRTYVTARRIIK